MSTEPELGWYFVSMISQCWSWRRDAGSKSTKSTCTPCQIGLIRVARILRVSGRLVVKGQVSLICDQIASGHIDRTERARCSLETESFALFISATCTIKHIYLLDCFCTQFARLIFDFLINSYLILHHNDYLFTDLTVILFRRSTGEKSTSQWAQRDTDTPNKELWISWTWGKG